MSFYNNIISVHILTPLQPLFLLLISFDFVSRLTLLPPHSSLFMRQEETCHYKRIKFLLLFSLIKVFGEENEKEIEKDQSIVINCRITRESSHLYVSYVSLESLMCDMKSKLNESVIDILK